ncbi:MAG: sigma-70 family RNA polymerase sigma factor [Cyanobacteriota bacterium]|nr:sigma-70 family RNA polymerase sigma factor [Cyanobacteriota bacterium]
MNPCTAIPHCPPAQRHGRKTALSLDLRRRNALVEAHRHLVPPLAGHYWRRCQEPREDLIQVGLLGLIRAAELYCHSLQTPFSAFARPHIRGAILHYLRDAAASVRLPRRQCELQSRLARLEEQMVAETGACLPNEAELRSRLGMTKEQWRLLRRHKQLCRPAPLDGALLDQLITTADALVEDPDDNLARVEGLLSGLDPRSQQVLRRVVVQGWSYRRTAAALDVSAMTVQRCLHKGLATLREQLSAGDGRPSQAGSLSSGRRVGRAPSAAQGWPTRHSPPPAAAPARLARR